MMTQLRQRVLEELTGATTRWCVGCDSSTAKTLNRGGLAYFLRVTD